MKRNHRTLPDSITSIRRILYIAELRHKTRVARCNKLNQTDPQQLEFEKIFMQISEKCYEIHELFKKIKKMEKVYNKKNKKKPYRDSMSGRNTLQVKL